MKKINVKQLLVGKPLKSTDDDSHLLTKLQALAMLSSDALSSIAYGTEQIVTVLLTLSAAAIWYSLPIAGVVLILLAALTLSYRQIIHAYPQGGGAYVVSTENLGANAGLVAGGSLLVDYMLTVAVSVSAGADAITSAIPGLHPYNLLISIILVLMLMFMNLRGLRESAGFLMVPVYTFVTMTVLLIIVGFLRVLTGDLSYNATSHVGSAVPGISVILLLKAFSSGSASLTGVEAISNAVPFFKKPKARNAAGTLVLMASILGIFFVGITFLNYYLGVVPGGHSTVLSQVAHDIFDFSGVGKVFYYIFQFSTAMILAVAANTGFSAFPMLSYNLAKNKYMPHMYMEKGDRLGYSNGIISLAAGAAVLLLIFNGSTERLIPLYSIGVFIPFALSQTGMVVKWRREAGKLFWRRATSNIVGAAISAVIVLILLVFRLADIWPFFVVMPILIAIFYAIKRHYTEVARQLRLEDRVVAQTFTGNTVIVLVGNMTNVAVGAMSYAQSIGTDVVAVHVSTKETLEKDREVQADFKKMYPDVRFSIVESSYRDIVKPVVRYVDLISKSAQKKNHTVTIVVPQFVPKHSWQNVLHNQMSVRMRFYLSWRDNVVVSNYSYHLKK
ncbi:amino acid permease [Lactococcus insecticola]|uniref:Amino acid permease n=1 Tax=Pseudolactococcus insecticola TaxID=2709158 RepID=A0A6A0BAR0_9LACT|nr:amino acid permease [Lactococcus insecticola]